MTHLIPITNDLFDIAARLRSVDGNYRVFYDTVGKKYQVHNVAQRGSTLAFIVPFDALDARTVEYARYTGVNNAETLFAQTEKDNERLEKQKIKELSDKSLNCLTEKRI